MSVTSNGRNVYVVGNYLDYKRMFINAGYSDVDEMEAADLVVFCGGEDVTPDLYNQHTHPTTHHNPERDDREWHIYREAKELGLPCVGICRGGQFLHVMNGGSLYQDVDNHAIGGTHEAYIVADLVPVQVTSTHHQMMQMDYGKECMVLMKAYQSTRKVAMSLMSGPAVERTYHIDKGEDIEALYWIHTNDLCFQPHPEFDRAEECRKVFFSFIDTYLFGEGE